MGDNITIPESFGVSVGDLIRMFRKKNNITQADLAKVLNLSVSTIANYESGKTVPDIYTLKQIYAILNIPTKITLKQPNEILLDLYNADNGLFIDDNGKVCGDIKEIKATIFNLYRCRKFDYCCVQQNGKVYLMNNTNSLEPTDTGLVKFCGDDVFVLAKFDGEKYINISTGKESVSIETIVAKSLGELDVYEITE